MTDKPQEGLPDHAADAFRYGNRRLFPPRAGVVFGRYVMPEGLRSIEARLVSRPIAIEQALAIAPLRTQEGRTSV